MKTIQARPQRLALALFASARDEERRRRPNDVALLVGGAALVWATARSDDQPTPNADNLTQLLQDWPDWLITLLGGGFALAVLYVIALITLSIASGDRPGLVRDLFGAAALALATTVALSQLVEEGGTALLGLPSNPEVAFPVLRVAVVAAVVLTAAPHVIRPVRRLGTVLILLAALAAVALAFGTVGDVVGALGVGVLAAALVHLLTGSPGGGPSIYRILSALDTVGVDVDGLTPVDRRLRGAQVLWGRDPDGAPVLVKVVGRDAADTQFLAKAWRSLWYRDSGPTLALTRSQQVEHEALFAVMAERAGCTTIELVTAVTTERGDALLVTRPPDWPLRDRTPLREDQFATAWGELGRLRSAGIVHGRIDQRNLRAAEAGDPVWLDWSAASFSSLPERLNADVASLLVLSALAVGLERAVDLAADELGSDRLATIVPFVQRAALSRDLARQVREEDLDLDALRDKLADAAGEKVEDLVRLRRVSLRRLAMSGLALFAVWLLITSLTEIGIDSLVDSFAEASLPMLGVALLLGQLPRVAQGISTLGSSSYPLPLGPTVTLQFAVSFINLVVPSTAARIATVARYFQKQGASVTLALTSGAIDGAAGFVIQIAILAVTLGFGWSSISFDLDAISLDVDVGRLLGLVVLAIAIGIATVAVVPKLRHAVLTAAGDARGALRGLGSPRRVSELIGGNLAAELLFAMTLGLAVAAYGHHVSLADLLAINVMVSMFAGLLPIPGGIGVSEGGLTAGLVAVGVPETEALAAVLSYRMITFYLPPIWGWVAMRWLTRNDYL